MRDPKLGVGKQEQDDFFTSEENVQRRKLEIEVEKTEEQARRREVDLCISLCVLALLLGLVIVAMEVDVEGGVVQFLPWWLVLAAVWWL